MDDISVFRGINPSVVSTATWRQALENIKSDRYKEIIEKVRAFRSGSKQYTEAKVCLPSVTFGGTFSAGRKNANIDTPSGFIIPDIDHIPKQLNSLLKLLCQDRNIWFTFQSPGGEGLKVGIRSNGIKRDEDHKKFFASVERYFRELYGIKIDPACKDISRLTFVSYDPEAWINPDPQYFDIQKWEPTPGPPPAQPTWKPDKNSAGKEKYAQKVLESCCRKIRESQAGDKHNTRLSMSRLIGGYLQWISESEVLTALEEAAVSNTDNPKAAKKNVRNGLEYGKLFPLSIENNFSSQQNRGGDIEYYYDPNEECGLESHNVDDKDDKDDKDDTIRHDTTEDDKKTTRTTVEKTNNEKCELNTSKINLASAIKEWLMNSPGSFTTEQLDNEFGLRSRTEKQNRSQILRKLTTRARAYNINNKDQKKELILKKDKTKKNLYHVLSTDTDWIDLSLPTVENFPLRLPFDLDQKISIPPKSIIIIAGSTNAGKTAILLHTLRLNLKSSFEKLYLVSEGAGEIKGRIRSFGDSMDLWKDNIMIASQTDNFDIAIESYNSTGFSCIDYLEPPDGHYYLLTQEIRDIYDSLDTGVAMIAIQKASQNTMGRGGEGTAEKARLYASIDYLCTCKRSIVCSLALMKVKQSLDMNMQGREIHFRITRGASIEPLTDWQLSSRVNRVKCAKEYESTESEESEYAYEFCLVDGGAVGVNFRDRAQWVKNFPNIDVDVELKRFQEDSLRNPWMTKKSWIWGVTGFLKKQNEKNQTQS